ncbi:hypothetical protein VNO78_02904 [Psophocarpus tetragonolobus]|uniref:Uncharacterized protein n=1 Tax=Psophocarpus tetragonolobus TaxID=3891 RepID=A0AAN9SZN7_PSOTE
MCCEGERLRVMGVMFCWLLSPSVWSLFFINDLCFCMTMLLTSTFSLPCLLMILLVMGLPLVDRDVRPIGESERDSKTQEVAMLSVVRPAQTTSVSMSSEPVISHEEPIVPLPRINMMSSSKVRGFRCVFYYEYVVVDVWVL